MTIDLEKIEERWKAATGRPWHVEENGFTKHTGNHATVYRSGKELRYICECRDINSCNSRSTPNVGNATFIAHSITDVPDLVAEVRRLQNILKNGTESFGFYVGGQLDVVKASIEECESRKRYHIFQHYPESEKEIVPVLTIKRGE